MVVCMERRIGLIGSHVEMLRGALKDEQVIHLELSTPARMLASFNLTHLVSFGYRELIPTEVIETYEGRIFNLHISLLPWNRGSHPNFWSWFEDTPKGVSIHRIVEKLDAGPIVAQSRVDMSLDETLSTSYRKLVSQGVELFSEVVPRVLFDGPNGYQACHEGSFHTLKEFERLRFVLSSGWDTPCFEVHEWGRRLGKTRGLV